MIGEHFLTVLMSTPRQQQEHGVGLCVGRMGRQERRNGGRGGGAQLLFVILTSSLGGVNRSLDCLCRVAFFVALDLSREIIQPHTR